MKKLLISLAVILVIAAGLLFYQRQRLTREFTIFSAGRSYYGYGLTLEIPAGGSGIRGLLHPYLEVRGVTLKFSFEGKEWKTELGTGKLAGNYWKPSALELKFPRFEWRNEGLLLEGPAFRLLSDQRIAQIHADSLQLQKEAGADSVRIHQPLIELGTWRGFLPEHFSLGWEKLESLPAQSAGSDGETIVWGKVSAGVKSQVNGARRRWEVFFEGAGGDSHSANEKLVFKPWNLTFAGDANDVPLGELKTLLQEVMVAVETTETQPSLEAFEKLYPLYQKFMPFVLRLDLKPEKTRFHWEGLSFQGKKSAQDWSVAGSEGKGDFRFSEKNFAGEASFLLGELKGKYPSGELDAKNLKLFYSVEYKISYQELLRQWFNYYAHIISLMMQGVGQTAIQSVFYALSQYPDQAVYELKSDHFRYTSPQTEGSHRNLTLGMKLNNLGLTLYSKGDLDQKFAKDPAKNIQGGQADLSLGLRLPWEKTLNLIRKNTQPSSPLADWSRELAGELGGLESHGDVDLGENWFGGKLDLRILMNLGTVLGLIDKLPVKNNEIGRDLGDPRFGRQFVDAFLKEGSLDFSLLIRRYSKMQALLQKEDPSAIMGMAVILPFVQMDSKADTLGVRLELKEGHVMLNGQRNDWIEGWIQKLRSKGL